jgi:hypothetical protein
MIVLGLTPEPERLGRLSSVVERCAIFLLHVEKENPFGDGALEKKREDTSCSGNSKSKKETARLSTGKKLHPEG